MTYANGVGGTTPSPNAIRQNGVGSRNPPNSLDYWQKVDGRHGVTTYYWNAAPYYGLENIYSTPPGQSPIHSVKNSNANIRRPAPFPLNLPPSATNPPPPQNPVIYNLPRVRLQQSNSNSSTGKSPDKENSEKKTPIVSTQVTTSSSSDPTKGLIWSIGSNADDRPNDQNGNPKNGSLNNNNSTNSHYAIIPTSKAQVYAQNSNSICKFFFVLIFIFIPGEISCFANLLENQIKFHRRLKIPKYSFTTGGGVVVIIFRDAEEKNAW